MIEPLIIYWNCASLQEHESELQLMLESLHPAIVCLSEARITPTTRIPKFPSYRLERLHPPLVDSSAGGLVFLIHNSISGAPRLDLSSPSGVEHQLRTSSQLFVLEATVAGRSCLISSVYLHPAAREDDIRSVFDLLVGTLENPAQLPTIMGGDFNAHHHEWGSICNNARGTALAQFAHDHGLDNQTSVHARGVSTRARGPCSVIDLVLTGPIPHHVRSVEVGNSLAHSSDHHPILVHLSPPLRALNSVVDQADERGSGLRWNSFDSMSKENQQHFTMSVAAPLSTWSTQWSHLLSAAADSHASSSEVHQAMERAYTELTNILVLTGETCIGRKLARAQPKYWFRDRTVRETHNEYRRACHAASHRPSRDTALRRKAAKKQFRAQAMRAKQLSWKKVCENIYRVNNKKSMFWQHWKQTIPSTHSGLNSVADEHGTLPSNHTQSLNNLGAYYAKVNSIDAHHIDPTADPLMDAEVEALRVRMRAEATNQPLPPFTFDDVALCCSSAPLRGALGGDDITPIMLRLGGTPLHTALFQFFTMTWVHGYLPLSWRSADVSSLYKGSGDKRKGESYRPISLTSKLVRMMERLLKQPIMSILERRGVLSPYQHGFRKHHGCYDNLLLLQHYMYKALRSPNGDPLPIVFLDFQKAFDKVYLPVLLRKLAAMGITGALWLWIDAFLRNRRLRTKQQGLCSDWFDLVTGVPQGSVLGPLLFLVYINDLLTAIRATGCLPPAFADDIAIFPGNTAPGRWKEADGYFALKDALVVCTQWAKDNKMTFNAKKSVIMFVAKNQNHHHIRAFEGWFKLCDFVLERVHKYRYVGVEHHCTGKWDQQFSSLVGKITYWNQMITRTIGRDTHPSQVRLLVNAISRAIIGYGLPFWRPKKDQYERLDSLLAAPLKRVLALPRSAHIASVLADFSILPTAILRQQLMFSFARRVLACEHSDPQLAEHLSPDLLYRHYNDAQSSTLRVNAVGRITNRFYNFSSELHYYERSLNGQTHKDATFDSKKVAQKLAHDRLMKLATGKYTKQLHSTTYQAAPYIRHERTAYVAKLRARLRFNVQSLRHNLMKYGKEAVDFCRACPIPIAASETREHVLLHCEHPVFHKWRDKILSLCTRMHYSPQPPSSLLFLCLGRLSDLPSCSRATMRTFLSCTGAYLLAVHSKLPLLPQ